jgi:hypothetical protein
MPITINIAQKLEADTELNLAYDSDLLLLTITVSDCYGTPMSAQLTLDQLDEFVFKTKRLLNFARYEEAAKEMEEELGEDEEGSDVE